MPVHSQKKDHKKGWTYLLVWYFNVICSILFSYYWMHLLAHNSQTPQLTSIYHFLALTSIFIIILGALHLIVKQEI